jgi:hypothetical protein
MSHIDSWDPKPAAPSDIRGEFRPICTKIPGVFFSEHIPRLAAQADKLAVIRSIHHGCTAHGMGMYWQVSLDRAGEWLRGVVANQRGHARPRVSKLAAARHSALRSLALSAGR